LFGDDVAKKHEALKSKISGLRERIQVLFERKKAPSLAVGVCRDGEILWEEGFGFSDLENKIPATEHTSYPLASITKLFTASGLMVLKERGLLNLDSPIFQHLPDLSLKFHYGAPERVTVRCLANHSSGLSTHFSYYYWDEPYLPFSIMKTAQRYGNIVAPQMERCQYANLGYGILGHLLSEISGLSYGEFTQREIFQPLCMNETHVFDEKSHEENDVVLYGPDASPENDENGQQKWILKGSGFHKIPYSECDTVGAAGVSSSVHDLLKFGMFHLKAMEDTSIISHVGLDHMKQPTSAPTIISGYIDENTKYGVGWRISKHNGYDIVWHDGGMSGISTKLVLVPSENIVAVALCNRFQPDVTDQAVSEILSELLSARSPVVEKESKKIVEKEVSLVGKWAGYIDTYEGKLPLTIWITDKGDGHSKLGEGDKHPLIYSGIRGSSFQGLIKGEISTEDAKRYPHNLNLEFKLVNNCLEGITLALCLKAPNNRMGYALGHWTKLEHT